MTDEKIAELAQELAHGEKFSDDEIEGLIHFIRLYEDAQGIVWTKNTMSGWKIP